MDDARLAGFRAQLKAMLMELDAEDARGAEGQKVVELDQCAVGRLSRMDALQGQAMAQATQARRDGLRKRIAAAFLRIEGDEFGYCSACGEEIAEKRLALDPTVLTCIDCARG